MEQIEQPAEPTEAPADVGERPHRERGIHRTGFPRRILRPAHGGASLAT
jgi:hypothetical protein